MNSITTFSQGGGPVRAALHFLRRLFPALVLAMGATGCAIQSEMVEMDDTVESLVQRQKELDEEMASVSEVAGRLYSLGLRVDSVEETLQKESKTVLQRDLVEALLETKKDRDNIERRIATMETYFVDRLSEYMEREERLIKDVTELRQEADRWMGALTEAGNEAEQLVALKKQYEELVAGMARLNQDLVALQAERKREGEQIAQMLGETVTRFEGRDNELAQGLGTLQAAQAELVNGTNRMAQMIEQRLSEGDPAVVANVDALQQAQKAHDQRVTTIESSLEQALSAVQNTGQRAAESDSLIVDQLAALRSQQEERVVALAEQLAVLTRESTKTDTEMAAQLAAVHAVQSETATALMEQTGALTQRIDETGTQVAALSEQTSQIEGVAKQAGEQVAALTQAQAELARQSATGDETLAGQLHEAGEQLAALTRESAESDTQLAARLNAVQTAQSETATALTEQTGALTQRMDETGTQLAALSEQTGQIEVVAKQAGEQVAALTQAQAELARQSATGDETLAGQLREAGEQLAALTRESAESDTQLAARLNAVQTAQSETATALGEQTGALTQRIDETGTQLAALSEQTGRVEEAAKNASEQITGLTQAQAELAQQSATGDETLAGQLRDAGDQLAALTRESAESDTQLAARLNEIHTAQEERAVALAELTDGLSRRIDEAANGLVLVAQKLEEVESRSDDRIVAVRQAHTESTENTRQTIADIETRVAALQTAQTTGVAAAEQAVSQLQVRADDSGKELEMLRTELAVSQTLLSGLAERVDSVQVAQSQASARAEQALRELEVQVSQGDPRLAEALTSIRGEGELAASIAAENAQELDRRVDESMKLLSSLQERLNAVEKQPFGSEEARVRQIETHVATLAGELAKVNEITGEVADRVAVLGEGQAAGAESVSGSVQSLKDLLAERDKDISEQLDTMRDAQRISSESATEQIQALKAQMESTGTASTELGRQLVALEHRIPAVDQARTEGMAESAKTVSTLEVRVSDALERIGALEAARGVTDESLSTLSQLSERITAIESASSGVAALDERIARLESREAELRQLAQVADRAVDTDIRKDVRDKNFEQVANRLSRVEKGLDTLSDTPPAWGADLDKKVADLASEFANLVEDQAARLSRKDATSDGVEVETLARQVAELNSELTDMINRHGGRIASLEKSVVSAAPDSSVAHLDRKLEAMGDTLTKGTDVLADSLAVLWERVITLEAIQKAESNEIRKRIGVVSESFR